MILPYVTRYPFTVLHGFCCERQWSGIACAGATYRPALSTVSPHTYTCTPTCAHAHAHPSARYLFILVRQSLNYINNSELSGLSAISDGGEVGQPLAEERVVDTYLQTLTGRLQDIVRTLADGIKSHLLPLQWQGTT